METEEIHLTFLGCGSMNEAILSGILAGGFPASQVTATVRRPERAAELRERHGITVLANSDDAEANRTAADADVVIIGVKPVGVADLLDEISPALPHGAVVIKIGRAHV